MENKGQKKNWIVTCVILALFVISQYVLRMQMFIYSDDAVAQERMLTMNNMEYIKYVFESVNGKWFTDSLGAFMGQWPFELWMAVDVILYTLGAWLAAYVAVRVENGGGVTMKAQ